MIYYVTKEKTLEEMDAEILDILESKLHENCDITLLGDIELFPIIDKLATTYNIPYITTQD